MRKLTDEEGRRTAVLAVPLDLERAYSLPLKASSVLHPAHARFLENWRRFFGMERSHRNGVAAQDFDVTLAELANHLTIDFLIKNPAPGEVAFLRKNSRKILKRLGLQSIFDLRQVKPSALARVAGEFGYPSYNIVDFERLSTDTSVSLVHWLRGRLGELAKTATRTANRLATLRSPG